MSYDILVFYMVAQKTVKDQNELEYLLASSENSNTMLIRSSTTDDFERLPMNSSLVDGVELNNSVKRG